MILAKAERPLRLTHRERPRSRTRNPGARAWAIEATRYQRGTVVSTFPDWLQTFAAINPVTYLLQGMRNLVLDGWDIRSLVEALAAIAGIGAFTMTLTLTALRTRTN